MWVNAFTFKYLIFNHYKGFRLLLTQIFMAANVTNKNYVIQIYTKSICSLFILSDIESVFVINAGNYHVEELPVFIKHKIFIKNVDDTEVSGLGI